MTAPTIAKTHSSLAKLEQTHEDDSIFNIFFQLNALTLVVFGPSNQFPKLLLEYCFSTTRMHHFLNAFVTDFSLML